MPRFAGIVTRIKRATTREKEPVGSNPGPQKGSAYTHPETHCRNSVDLLNDQNLWQTLINTMIPRRAFLIKADFFPGLLLQV